MSPNDSANTSGNMHENSQEPPTTAMGRDTSTGPYSAAGEVSDGAFSCASTQERSYHLAQRKRKKPMSDKRHFASNRSTSIFQRASNLSNLSNRGNSASSSNYKASGKQLLASADMVTGCAAPTRKRLVDSLDTTECSAKEPSSLNTSDGIIFHSSPVRVKDVDTSPHRIETYNYESQLSATPSSVHLRNSRVTYARERSFLNDRSISSTDGTQSSPGFLPENHRSKQPRLSLQGHLYAGGGENIDSGSVRGLHELRQAGENAHFQSAVDLILEDIEDALNSKSDPCNGFAQLCTKLLDPDSVHCFSDCGFEKRFLQCVTSDLDTLSASFAICAYELVRSGGGFSRTPLAQFLPTVLGLSSRLIKLDDDMLSVSANHRCHIACSAVQAVVSRLSSTIYGEQPAVKVSPRIVGLRCIQSVLSNCQEPGDSTRAIRSTPLGQLVSLLMLEFPEGPEDFPLQPENYQVLVLTLSILEAFTIMLGPLANGYRDIYQPLSRLCSILDMSGHCCDNGQYRHILILYVRVVLNITNNNDSLCEAFSTPTLVSGLVNIVRTEFEQILGETLPKGDSSDAVILALGTLINLTEKCKSSRIVFLQTTSNSTPLLKLLLILFSASIDSVSEVG